MDYQLKTHCPNCFKPSNASVCASCNFDVDIYLNHYAAVHHLPLFTSLEKGYLTGRVLGESNFAIVYAGIREKDQLSCAVKEYYPRDLAQRGLDNTTVKPKHQQQQLSTWQNRFIQEAELLRSCYDHPSVESGIVRYTALLEQHNTAYLVMERLKGISLSDTLSQQKKIPSEQICLWLKPLLETLEKLHAKEIYHRNISPNNIFLAAADKPILMDFGLARAGAQDELLKPSTLGTGVFIAPEQIIIGGYCDQRTDLYALGAVLYLCLQGEAPPPIEARRQNAPLKSLNSTDKTAQALQDVAAQCLDLNLNMRPKNATHILADLAPFWVAATKVSPAPAPAPPLLETIIPSRDIEEPPAPLLDPPENPFLTPPLAPHSLLRNLTIFFCSLLALVGLAYGGIIAYQHYDQKESAQRRQDNLLFSQSQSIADYKTYLTSCITCENKQRAVERIALLEQDQKILLSQQKQQEQEALLFNKARTVEDFKTYLSHCVLCADKTNAEAKLAQLEQITKEADEKQLAEQEKEFVAALKTNSLSVDFYQQECPKYIQFWQRTAEQGYAVAQLLLGDCYRSGEGVKQDYAETLNWYRKAADQGNSYAQNNLAMMYQKGYGTKKNEAEAANWYRKAAEQGYANAQYSLGVMYEKGEGLTQDYKQAVDWYLRAAEQENAQAQYSLGVMYHYGSGVTQDYQAALLWYHKSAKQDNDKAQYLLGVMYQNGYGVDINEMEALSWYQKSATQGNVDAIGQMKALEAAKTTSNPELFGTETIKP